MLDTRLDQLAHARATLPEINALASLTAQSQTLDRDLALAATAVSDVQRDIDKAEADVQLVRDRAARDRARLDSGVGTSKDLQALQHELTSLARRQSELEDLELEVMEHAEALQAQLDGLNARRTELDERLAEVTAARDAATGAQDAEVEDLRHRRGPLADAVGADLLALYDKIRAASHGVGAAALRQRRCEGCRLELNPLELDRIKSAPADEVLRCEECRRILVRTPESGLA